MALTIKQYYRTNKQVKLKKIVAIIGFLTLLAVHTQAQGVQVEQKLDSVNGIFIGQQAHMTVAVTAEKDAKVAFPAWKPMSYLVPGVELLAVEGDTVDADNGRQTIRRRLTITSFDENLYPIPPVEVKVGGKAYTGSQLALKVVTVDVDTLHPNQFYPPKDVQKNPFLWSEWRTPFLLSLLFIALLALALWLYLRLKANKPIITSIRIIKKVLPHQKAMKAIDEIKAEHMTASEDQKEYYTRLTDTLRQYIRERFGFNAMEMTTSEIIFHLQESGDSTMIAELKDLFETADLVKFAKYSTLMGENDMNLVNAINFIDLTKLEGQPTEERVVPQLTEGDKKTRKNRITIKALLWTIAVVDTALIVYVLYAIMQLLF